MRLDHDLPAVQQARVHGPGQQTHMVGGLVGKKAGHHQQAVVRLPFLRRHGGLAGIDEIHVAQGLHQLQTLLRHTGGLPLPQGPLPVGADAVGLEGRAGAVREGDRIVEIAEVRGPDGGMLRPVHGPARAGRGVGGMGQHAFPGAVLQREGEPALGPGGLHVIVDAALLQAALQTAPAPEGLGPVLGHIGPKVQAGALETAELAHGGLQTAAGPGQTQIALPGGPQVGGREEFLQIVEAHAVLPCGPQTVPHPDAAGQIHLRRREADEQPAHGRPGRRRAQGVVQALPVTGAEAARCRGFHVHIGEIGGDGARGHMRGRQGGQGPAPGPEGQAHPEPPVEEAPGRAQQGGASLIDAAQPAAVASVTALGIVIVRELPPRGLAERQQGIAQPVVAAHQTQGREAALVQQMLQGAQLVDLVKQGRHLGMALIEQRTPPHGQLFPGLEMLVQQRPLHGPEARPAGPCGVLAPDLRQPGIAQGRQRDVVAGHVPQVPVGHGGGRLQMEGQRRSAVGQQGKFFHGRSFPDRGRKSDPPAKPVVLHMRL